MYIAAIFCLITQMLLNPSKEHHHSYWSFCTTNIFGIPFLLLFRWQMDRTIISNQNSCEQYVTTLSILRKGRIYRIKSVSKTVFVFLCGASWLEYLIMPQLKGYFDIFSANTLLCKIKDISATFSFLVTIYESLVTPRHFLFFNTYLRRKRKRKSVATTCL